MKINGELKAQEIQHKISEQNYEKDNDTSIFNFSEPENSNGIDYDELIKTSNQSNLQIEDLDFDANYSFEDRVKCVIDNFNIIPLIAIGLVISSYVLYRFLTEEDEEDFYYMF